MPPKGKKRRTEIPTYSVDDFQNKRPKGADGDVTFTSLSSDHRRVHSMSIPVAAPATLPYIEHSGSSHSIQNDVPQHRHFDAERFVEDMATSLNTELPAPSSQHKNTKETEEKTKVSDQSLHDWFQLRDEYLNIIMSNEGPCDNSTNYCHFCNIEGIQPLYICRDCFSMQLMCRNCIAECHRDRPLDNILKWNGQFFERSSLYDIDSRPIQLGHLRNTPCPSPINSPSNFTVVHTNGIHHVRVQYCGCPKSIGRSHAWQQLLRHEWFPATHKLPQTCFTFRLLENFHAMTLVGKLTPYDYYRSLEKLTDNSGSYNFKDRLASFRRVVREWRHLKALKRGGRGNDGKRPVSETLPGELAVQCPACPKPSVNLPKDWENVTESRKFLYRLFIAVDACFRLKRKLVSSEEADPGLGTGWLYMVENTPYRNYLITTTNESEMSTCSGLAALDHANSRNSRGAYHSSGVALGCCARHEMIQPNGVGDLQKGERYCNIDWIIASLLRFHDSRLPICLSYDICCQYCRNFLERLQNLPLHVRPKEVQKFTFVIPKLHIYGHTLACQLRYSLNLTPGVGRTDGEGIERNWAGQGPISTSTMEMGPGSRHDTLDDHWAYWNWQKLVGLGVLLLKRFKNAYDWKTKQQAAFEVHSLNQASKISNWEKMILDFEQDATKPNPYELPKSGLTLQKVRLELAREEAVRLTVSNMGSGGGGGGSEREDIEASDTTSSFLLLALDVEEKQRILLEDLRMKGQGSTDKQVADIVDKKTRLRRLVLKFQNQQDSHMPIVPSLRVAHLKKHSKSNMQSSASSTPSALEPEALPLFLPSQLTLPQLQSCPREDLADIEFRLRNAQCSESLTELRNQLVIKSRLRTYKFGQARHQGQLRRSNNLINQNESKIRLHSKRYQDAHKALQSLGQTLKKNVGWRELSKSDIRCMEDPEDPILLKERRKLGKRSRRTGKLRAEEVMMGQPDAPDEDEDEEGGPDEGGREDDDDQTVVSSEATTTPTHTKDSLVKRTGEGYRSMSWIWSAADGGGFLTDEELYAGLRVEWAKSRARLHRWTEELLLLKEEMRRTIVSLKHNAKTWTDRATVPEFASQPYRYEGTKAYALRQANVYLNLAARFSSMWAPAMNTTIDAVTASEDHIEKEIEKAIEKAVSGAEVEQGDREVVEENVEERSSGMDFDDDIDLDDS